MSNRLEAPKRVLVVDDEPGIRRRICETLAGDGWETRECADGVEALNALETFPAAVVVLDVRMPRLDGRKTLKEIRKSHPWTQVVMLTAFADDEKAAEECCNLHAFGFLRKPGTPTEIRDTCNKALQAIPLTASAIADWFGKLPDPDKLVYRTFSGRQITARQLRDEIERQTPIGQEFIRQVDKVAAELILTRLQ